MSDFGPKYFMVNFEAGLVIIILHILVNKVLLSSYSASGTQSIGASASASVLPMNIQG